MSPVPIGPPRREQQFAGVPYGFTKPVREVLKEGRLIFGDKQPVSIVLSLGSGRGVVLSTLDNRGTLFTRMGRDADTVAKELSHQLSGAGVYLRLNVDKGLENTDTSDWCRLGSIISHTEVYLQTNAVTPYIDEAFQWLLQRDGSVTLGQLGTSV